MNTLPPTGASERQITQAIRELIEGRSNAVGTVTLTANTTTTTATLTTVNRNAIVILAPQTANAAAAVATTYASVSAAGGAFTITHANNAQTDRTFGYLVIGG
jgi:hypothetical protein